MTAVADRRADAGAWSFPDAVQILPAEAPRERWLAERRQGLGGSDVAAVVGLDAYRSRYELWLDKTGRAPEKPMTDAMEWGVRLEPVVAQWWSDTTGIPIQRRGLLARRDRPWMRVSVDRLAADGGILEVKTTNWRNAEEWDDDQVSDRAELQVQWALAVTGRSHGHVAVLIDGREPLARRVERDEDLIATLTDASDRFWHEHVLADVAPSAFDPLALPAVKARWADALTETREVDPAALAAVLDPWRAARAARLAAEKHEDACEAALRDLIGDAAALTVDGRPAVTCKPVATSRIDVKALREAHPDIADAFTTTTTSRRLHEPKTKDK